MYLNACLVFLICNTLYLDNFYQHWERKLLFLQTRRFWSVFKHSLVWNISELIFASFMFHFELNGKVSFGSCYQCCISISCALTQRFCIQFFLIRNNERYEAFKKYTAYVRCTSSSNKLTSLLNWWKMKQFHLIKIMDRNRMECY